MTADVAEAQVQYDPGEARTGPPPEALEGALPRRREEPLRVLVVHNRYQIAGGEDAAVEREIASLRGAGQEVEAVILDNAAIQGPLDRLRVAFQAPHAPQGIATVVAAARRFRPDIVHAHNTFPLISPAVHGAVRRLGAATVQTLHNFRLMCANGLLLREGKPCERCIGGSPYQAVRFGCYRGSKVGTLAVARMIDRHRREGTWQRDVDRFIVLSAFARDRFLAAGLPADRLRTKPNGIDDPGPVGTGPRAGALFVGRLSEEKGVRVLAEAAALAPLPITVIGDGPLMAALKDVPGLNLLGYQDRQAVRAAMARAAVVVVPSICYEGLPTVIPEAFAAGTPVVASGIGAMPELVAEGVTGFLAAPGDPVSLAGALARIEADPAAARRMGAAARTVFERNWLDEVVTAETLAIYREAVAARAADPAFTIQSRGR